MTENAQTEKAEWKIHDTENGRKYTHHENDRLEKVCYGKLQKLNILENGKKDTPGK